VNRKKCPVCAVETICGLFKLGRFTVKRLFKPFVCGCAEISFQHSGHLNGLRLFQLGRFTVKQLCKPFCFCFSRTI